MQKAARCDAEAAGFCPQAIKTPQSPEGVVTSPLLSDNPHELARELARAKTQAAFDLLDLDNDGELTRNEFTRFIGRVEKARSLFRSLYTPSLIPCVLFLKSSAHLPLNSHRPRT